MKTLSTRNEAIAYQLASWVCIRQNPVTKRATVKVWAEANDLRLTDDEIDYALGHWTDYVEPLTAA
ncbi:MAG: hypothetical protein KZQ97_13925 [Candidatus Thiodiazotropha sp. (ex Dulcina madagascariensis)]|nr:hypothetical protein [Candidatus Thiodiazotropha sp. (ex Dulcina madagascariensis)]